MTVLVFSLKGMTVFAPNSVGTKAVLGFLLRLKKIEGTVEIVKRVAVGEGKP